MVGALLAFVLGMLLALLFHTQPGAVLRSLLRHVAALLPLAGRLQPSDATGLLRLAPKISPAHVEALARHAPRLAPHTPELMATLPLLRDDHLCILLDTLDRVAPRLPVLVPLLPHLRRHPQSLPALLEPRALTILLDHVEDVPRDDLEALMAALPRIAPLVPLLVEADCLDLWYGNGSLLLLLS